MLNREQIVEAALALADRDGLAKASMRRLADELGVGTMTLYSYYSTKDELLDAAIEHVAGSVRIPQAGGAWRPALHALITDIHRSLVEHPCGVELRLTRPILSPAALRTTEAGMQILRGAGFSKRDAARGWRLLFVYTFGYAAFSGRAVPTATLREWQGLLEALPPHEYPALHDGAAEAVETMTGHAAYEFGLDRLLDGLEAQLERGAGGSG